MSTFGGPRPGRGMSGIAMFFHVGKTAALANAVLKDERVHWLPKMVFLTGIGALAMAVLFPELAADLVGLYIPGVGWAFDALGIPVEASFDWVVAVVAAFNLLKIFPTEIVGEHYDRLFRSSRRAA
jgi:hypothetical protein